MERMAKIEQLMTAMNKAKDPKEKEEIRKQVLQIAYEIGNKVQMSKNP